MNLHYTLNNKALIITESSARANRPTSPGTQCFPVRPGPFRSP